MNDLPYSYHDLSFTNNYKVKIITGGMTALYKVLNIFIKHQKWCGKMGHEWSMV